MASLTRFDNRDIVNDTSKVTTSTWTGNTNALTTVHTSSTQAILGTPTSSGTHYIEVLDKASSDTTAEVQYSVAYGHVNGSGSQDFTNAVGSIGNSPTKNIYSQYRQLVFGDETQKFTFDEHIPDDIYVININRSRYKHNLKPGSLNLTLRSGSVNPGSTTLKLSDDSITATGSSKLTNAGRQFNIVSGSSGIRLGTTLTQTTNSGSFGLFYPDAGFLILNPDALDHYLSGPSVNTGGVIPNISSNTQGDNHVKLLHAINSGSNFVIDSEEKISSTYYFARVKNYENNYTTNPSFIDNSGNVLINSMIDNPTVYITTVGLYSEGGELLAVAKLSQPVVKDFTKEALVRIKLDY
tara:strand:- start:5387 stop:6445 length:1059 start_codon:yes stop_codon:yes gene_type:complete